MADGTATRSSRGHRTICLPVSEDAYLQAIDDPVRFRRLLDEGFRATPELFPPNFALGYDLKDDRMSVKQRLPIRRIRLKDGTAYSVRSSFLMPYMTARVADVEGPLFLRKFGVPYWRWPRSSAATRCSGSAWSAGWIAAASWGPPSARRSFPCTCSPTNIIKRSTARRSTSPRPSARAVCWGPNRPRGR